MTHKALIRQLQISCLGLDPIDPLRLLVDDVIAALRENAMREVQRLGQEIEQEPVANVKFMRQVLSVAIAVLYEHYKDDVLRVFTLDDLQTVIDLSDSLRPQQVEDIYKRAWDILEVATLPQRTEQEPWCMKMNGCKTKCEDCPVEVVEPEPEQEPVAWMHIQGRHQELSHFPLDDGEISRGWEQYPLYTTPPQRTWVGLTDEEIKPCWHEACQTDLELTSQLVVYFARAIEAKLKEKNT
jgi:hypothetical protein